MVAQLIATIGAGLLAEAIGLRATAWLAPLGGLVGAAILWASPVRRMMTLPPPAEGGEPRPAPVSLAVAAAVEWEQPPGA